MITGHPPGTFGRGIVRILDWEMRIVLPLEGKLPKRDSSLESFGSDLGLLARIRCDPIDSNSPVTRAQFLGMPGCTSGAELASTDYSPSAPGNSNFIRPLHEKAICID